MQSTPRPIRFLLLYLTVVFLGGALLAPCLYWGTQWAAGHWPALSHLAASPFHRFLDRALLGLALLCLWPLLRGGGMRSWRDLGFGRQDGMGGQAARGFALGWVSLAVVALLAFVCGARALAPNHSAADILRCLLGAASAAAIVAVLEELVFRAALFGLLRQSMSWPAALVLSSAVYAAVHFIHSNDAGAPVRWNSGLELLWRMASHPPPMIPAFLTLFAAGSILALSYQRRGALYFSIGLHAGWIFWLKSYRFFLRPSGASSAFWGTDNLIDGWFAFLVLAALFVVLLYTRPENE
ncbi:MAG TPA: CPBP family intramembrane glutamic endopeptidase [Verrucomicrobiae bacterium]|jgi:hypothetical protein